MVRLGEEDKHSMGPSRPLQHVYKHIHIQTGKMKISPLRLMFYDVR